ncbi:MAG TPA: crotonase/enoyl-CoA hydratase family protein [Steroidobacteraceae bacterium]|nr:crotonase/enoyl-CoA hydratase family protein [Steroidobacteraceae bacterium]
MSGAVRIERSGHVATVILSRPGLRNAVDPATAEALAGAFLALEGDRDVLTTVLWGEGGHFCAGADLSAVRAGWDPGRLRPPSADPQDAFGPMGPTRLQLTKPVVAAVSGYAVAGGLELALWCDLRVAEETAVFGVFCRRFGVPLIDGGTFRLPRLVGQSRAMDMVLTGRPVDAREAFSIGLANRVVPDGAARPAAESLAAEIAAFPQRCLRADRASLLGQWSLDASQALSGEFERGLAVLQSGESAAGAGRFLAGAGRGGRPAG